MLSVNESSFILTELRRHQLPADNAGTPTKEPLLTTPRQQWAWLRRIGESRARRRLDPTAETGEAVRGALATAGRFPNH
ncbi:MAG: hypothetical protein ACJ789_21100 [Thermomicrobiales bacterium]